MALSCGLIGLPGCGKTTIFNAITAAGAAIYDRSEHNRAVVKVPDPRVEPLVLMYRPAKTVLATLTVVDVPGLRAGSVAGDGRGRKSLGHIKDVDTLLHVVRCHGADGAGTAGHRVTAGGVAGSGATAGKIAAGRSAVSGVAAGGVFRAGAETGDADPARDVEAVDFEMMVADSETLQNKINRLAKRARSGDKDAVWGVNDCQKVLKALDKGVPVRRQNLDAHELASVRECNLLTLKPVLYIANLGAMSQKDSRPVRTLSGIAEADNTEMIIVCGKDEADISQLDPADQLEFLAELGLQESSMERLIRAAYRKLGLLSFFTAGPKEVHVWTCRQGDKAPTAAGCIHTDMERGFIRMEVIRFEDLIQLGSEAAVARAGKQQIEGKDYLVRDGDIVVVRFSP